MFYCEACGQPRHHHDHGFYALADKGKELDGICEECAQNSDEVHSCGQHYWLAENGWTCPKCGEDDENYDGPSDRDNPLLNFDAETASERISRANHDKYGIWT